MMEQLVSAIVAAVNSRTLYPAAHPRVMQAVDAILAALADAAEDAERDSVTMLIVGDDLVAEQNIVRNPTLSQRQFIEVLKRRRIERLTLAAGLSAEECHQFIGSLAWDEAPESSPHIILGRVHVVVDDEESVKEDEPQGVTADQFDFIRDAFKRFRVDGNLPIGPMEQLVWGFIDSMSKSTRLMLPLAKLKEHDEYTFVHAVNVSLLVLAQARSFGIQGSMLHAFGMAALLHDIGKLMVPLEVLNKPGKLDGAQWAVMQRHSEEGAWYLSRIDGAAPLSVVVAYEHHMRFDGQPNYPVTRIARSPNLATRMTSIADSYDAISTTRPYMQPLMRATAIEILRNRAGTFYDPMLLANFIQIVCA
jgi:HD-GYP domain-containing protein (c-di-GMP phosphodiesterase class II)